MQAQMKRYNVDHMRVEAVEGDGVPARVCSTSEEGTLLCPQKGTADDRALVLPKKTKIMTKDQV